MYFFATKSVVSCGRMPHGSVDHWCHLMHVAPVTSTQQLLSKQAEQPSLYTPATAETTA
jgi:hypothetical protein